jgi:cytochrome c
VNGRSLLVAVTAALAACGRGQTDGTGAQSAPDGGFALGHAPTPQQIAAVDIDAAPDGRGLPPGRGDAERGRVLYAEKCASCHGVRGEGMAPNPALIGREPRAGFPFSADYKTPRTIGNYWPYAPTLFDYIRRAMPLAAPGTLTNDEVYSVTAWLLAANEVIPSGATLDSASLVAIRMPARDRFVPDDRRGGREIR